MKVLLFLLLAANAWAKAPQPKVLIFGKAMKSVHEKIVPVAGKALVTLATANGFSATFSDDPAVFTTQKLQTFSTILFLDVSQGVLETEQKIAFEKYFEQGGGLISVHASISAGKDWPWYRDLIGTLFSDHPKLQRATVHLDKSASPQMKGVADSWSQPDEWYNFTNALPASQRILATVDESSYQGGKMGKVHPITWCKEIGKARVWYTAMGHEASLYQDMNADFDRQIVWALKWTAHVKELE
jgi:type 1 glutamine amidotransferase